jgi:protocatechuate 3,4-dioxygenase beta subunit
LNENDPILGLIEDPARRATLLAQKAGDGIWQIGIHLQGDTETVFLDI